MGPRFAAVLTVGTRGIRDALRATLGLALGTLCAYLLILLALPVLFMVLRWSSLLYGGLALLLGGLGLRALFASDDECVTKAHSSQDSSGLWPACGIGMGLVISPCCAPALLGVLIQARASASLALGVAAVAAFAFGQLVPLAVLGILSGSCANLWHRWNISSMIGTVTSGLLLALGAYYAVLI